MTRTKHKRSTKPPTWREKQESGRWCPVLEHYALDRKIWPDPERPYVSVAERVWPEFKGTEQEARIRLLDNIEI